MTGAAPLVVLGGAIAMELAPRLEASGYGTAPLLLEDHEAAEGPSPAAVILSPAQVECIGALRRRWGALPILLGCPTDDVASRCLVLASGADDLWLTSVGASDLLTRLRLHLGLRQGARRSAPPVPTTRERFKVGDLQVDPRNHSVQRDGTPVALTAREFQLLMLLLRHSPMVVSREQILQEIWPEERASGSNVIEVYVRYLRRKLEEGNRPRLLHTVRGLGYCLRESP